MADKNKRDFIDDLVDIQKDWRAVSNPLGSLTSALTQEPTEQKPFNPGDYKWKPRGNTISCMACQAGTDKACHACVDVCPVNAITLTGSTIQISDECRKCGLCIAACPSEAISDSHHSARQLYDDIARAAGSHEQCYVTCTRALGRKPEENEILLPCVGCVPTEVWFAILVEYPNVSVYLPYGICDKCRTTTGELAYSEAIAAAEELTGRSVGLEMEEASLGHDYKRSFERRELMNSIVGAGASAMAVANPALASANAVRKRIQEHAKQINRMTNELERMAGTTNAQHRKRLVVQKRQLILSALQHHPRLAERLTCRVPVCDSSRCTLCGDCVKACPAHAIELNEAGRVTAEPIYCMDCGACIQICPEAALTMEEVDPEVLVVPDPDAEAAKEAVEKGKEELERLKKQGRKALLEGIDALGELAGGRQTTATKATRKRNK